MHVDIIENYLNSSKRLFLLDYDGTLANIAPAPEEALPTPEILTTLKRLSSDPRNLVAVVSGRNHKDLEDWLGDLPLAFGAEHGLLYRPVGEDWQYIMQIDTSWKDDIRPLMQELVQRYKGALIEEKSSGLVWHYRQVADQAAAEEAAKALIAKVLAFAQKHQLRILHVDKVVELAPESVNKSFSTQYWLKHANWDFVLIAGDSLTDEDMFRVAPKSAFTIKVGSGETLANTRLKSPADMLALLNKLSS